LSLLFKIILGTLVISMINYSHQNSQIICKRAKFSPMQVLHIITPACITNK